MRKLKAVPSEVAEVSTKLQEEIDKAKAEEARKAAAGQWSGPNSSAERPPSPALEKMVENTFLADEDLAEEARELDELLKSDERLGHHPTALDDAEHNARRAFRVFLTTKQLREDWEEANRPVFGAMRAEATRQLQADKAEGRRTKQITDADVEAECARLFGDEYGAQEARRRRFEKVEKDAAHRAEMWASRCRTLGVLVSKSR